MEDICGMDAGWGGYSPARVYDSLTTTCANNTYQLH